MPAEPYMPQPESPAPSPVARQNSDVPSEDCPEDTGDRSETVQAVPATEHKADGLPIVIGRQISFPTRPNRIQRYVILLAVVLAALLLAGGIAAAGAAAAAATAGASGSAARWVGRFRSQLPQANMTFFQSSLEGSLDTFEAQLSNWTDNALDALNESAMSAEEAARSAYERMERQRMQVALPLMFDPKHATQEFWEAMHELVRVAACFDIKRLICELMIDKFCDCDESSVHLDVHARPPMVQGTCAAGTYFRLVYSKRVQWPSKNAKKSLKGKSGPTGAKDGRAPAGASAAGRARGQAGATTAAGDGNAVKEAKSADAVQKAKSADAVQKAKSAVPARKKIVANAVKKAKSADAVQKAKSADAVQKAKSAVPARKKIVANAVKKAKSALGAGKDSGAAEEDGGKGREEGEQDDESDAEENTNDDLEEGKEGEAEDLEQSGEAVGERRLATFGKRTYGSKSRARDESAEERETLLQKCFKQFGAEFEKSGAKVTASSKFQFLPRLDFSVNKGMLKLNVSGDVNAVLNFTAKTERDLKFNCTMFKLPDKPVKRSKCVSYFCVTFVFQSSVKLELDFQGKATAASNVSADYAFEFITGINLQSGKPLFHANSTKLLHWEEFKFHESSSSLAVKVTLVPTLQIFTVPGAPVSLLPSLDSEVKVGLPTRNDAEGSLGKAERRLSSKAVHFLVAQDREGSNSGKDASGGSKEEQRGPKDECHQPPSALNLGLQSSIMSFGLPEEIDINWVDLASDIVASLEGAAMEVVHAIRRMTRDCEVPITDKAMSAIKTVAQASMGAVKAVVPKNLDLAFPEALTFQGHPPFCWTVDSAAASQTCSGADDSVSCPKTGSTSLQPRAQKQMRSHLWPHGSVAMTMELRGCDFRALDRETALRDDVDARIKEVYAAQIGHGVQPSEIVVEHVEEIEAFVAIVSPPAGVGASLVQDALSDTEEMGAAVAEVLSSAPGIGGVFQVPVEVAGVSAPAMHPCLLVTCGRRDSGKLKSHGRHTVCRHDPRDRTDNGRGNIRLASRGVHDDAGTMSLVECQDECKRDPGCHGMEYEHKWGRCEIWLTPLHFCSNRPVETAQGRGLLFECFSRCL